MDFGKVYCINLKERTDRRESATHELNSIGITDINWFDGIKTKKGHAGCIASHLAILEECRNEKRFTIFEDDVKFLASTPLSHHADVERSRNVSDIDILKEAEKQLPENWDLLYLGANLLSPIKQYSKNLYYLHNGYCNHAIIYNNPEVSEFVLFYRDLIRKIDVFYNQFVQERFNCFIVNPMIASQADGYSNIVNQTTGNFKMLIDNFNKYTRHD